MEEDSVTITIEPEVEFATSVNVGDKVNNSLGSEPEFSAAGLESFRAPSEGSETTIWELSSNDTDEPESVNSDVETKESMRERAKRFLNEINLSPPTLTRENNQESLEDTTSPPDSDESNPNLQGNAAQLEENQAEEEYESRIHTCRDLLARCQPQCPRSARKELCGLVLLATALIIFTVYSFSKATRHEAV